MLGSTAGVHPSQDCPVGMVDGGGASILGLPDQEPPPPPSRAEADGSSPSTGAGLSSPSTSARPSSLPPFLHFQRRSFTWSMRSSCDQPYCSRRVGNYLHLDVATRWNSTHLMIKTALEYRKAFAALKLQDPSYTCQPTNEQWETAQSVCSLLEVFLDATMVVSGTLYPTAHLYFHELWKIHLTLEREANNEEAAIRSMVQVMKTKFMKYWKLSYLSICLPVILDPRYKFKFLELCLKSGLETEATKYLTKVKKTFKDLFTEYSSHEDDSTLKNDQGTSSVATIDNPWEQWNKQVQEEQQNRAKLTELTIYLKDAVHPQEEGFDILCWWSANAHKYPIISCIAKDVLAAPVSTVASESAFSTGGRILSDYRSHMIGSTVEALICLQDWLRPPGTTHVNTITSDVVYAKRADIYGSRDDIFEE